MHGTFETDDGRPTVRFERRLAHPVEAVWRAVTEPSELAHWFPAQVTVDHRVGGTISFTSEDDGMPASGGEVLEFEPPHRFSFTWGASVLRIDLERDGDGCRMTFIHTLEARDAAARDAAGWHVCLDRLEERLAGASPDSPSGDATDEWRAHYEEYQRRGVPAGAPVPGETPGA
jgi:uncharacterized protein YndB with AHSA1/START domain